MDKKSIAEIMDFSAENTEFRDKLRGEILRKSGETARRLCDEELDLIAAAGDIDARRVKPGDEDELF